MKLGPAHATREPLLDPEPAAIVLAQGHAHSSVALVVGHPDSIFHAFEDHLRGMCADHDTLPRHPVSIGSDEFARVPVEYKQAAIYA